MKHILPLIALALVAASPLATAAETDSGFYVLASTGPTDTGGRKAQADTTIRNLGVTTFQSSADEKDIGYKLQLGYRINRYVAIEGGYMDLGRYTYAATATVPAATRDAKGDISAWNIGAAGILPLGQFNLFGKVGVAAYHLKFHCAGTGIACVNPERTSNGNAFHYGLGAEWNFLTQWFLRGEYEVIQKIGDDLNATGTSGTTRADLKMANIGVGYRF